MENEKTIKNNIRKAIRQADRKANIAYQKISKIFNDGNTHEPYMYVRVSRDGAAEGILYLTAQEHQIVRTPCGIEAGVNMDDIDAHVEEIYIALCRTEKKYAKEVA